LPQVTAQCILRGVAGHSVADTGEPPSGVEAERLRADPTFAEQAAALLTELGFEVGERGGATLTVTGGKELFERVFATELQELQPAGAGAPSWRPASPPRIPSSLVPYIDQLVFPIEPIFMA
jgi:hypothetical protein